MRKASQGENTITALANFNVTFELTLYLHSFRAISISSQGSYYIAVSLCPKNAMLTNPDSPSENSLGKARLTRIFYIKYTSIFSMIQITLSPLLNVFPSPSLLTKTLFKVLLLRRKMFRNCLSTTSWSYLSNL